MQGDKSTKPSDHTPRLAIWLCWIQGAYFFVLGVWPLISIDTFQAVTGKKTDHLVTGRESDHWLVNTVGVLVAAIGLVFLIAAWRRRVSLDAAVLAICSGSGLAAIDITYVARGTILPVYLGDAAIEIVFVAVWLVSLRPIYRGN
jgi:hypothetical protein